MSSPQIVMFKPVPFMKAERFTTTHKIETVFPHGFWVETKFDGWRIQLHKSGNIVRLYSKSGEDYTVPFSSVVNDIISSNLITVDKCIVDGEILTWHKGRREFGLSTSLMPVAAATRDPTHTSEKIIVIRLFDVLRINDELLLDVPLRTRHRRMCAMIQGCDVLQVVPHIKLNGEDVMHTWADMAQLLKQAVDRNEEGLVLKDPSSRYIPGGRRIGAWMKVKPDYFETGATEYDLLIVGAECGKGTSIRNFLVALAEDPAPDSIPTRFRSVAHFSGMKAIEYKAVKSIIDGYMVRVNFSKKRGDISKNNTNAVTFIRYNDGHVVATWTAKDSYPLVRVVYSGKNKEGCDWVIDPRRSLVVTLKADYRLVPSTTFAMFHTLRFARLHEKGLRINRSDLLINGDAKPWYDCMCLSEWNQLVQASERAVMQVDGAEAQNDRRFEKIAIKSRIYMNPVSAPKVPVQSSRAYHGNADTHGGMLSNFVIYVMPCEKDILKELEQMAAGLGARVYASEPPLYVLEGKTFVRISTNNTSQVFANCKRSDKDVVQDTWLRDCYSRHALNTFAIPPKLQPKYMWNTSEATLGVFGNNFDIFGDSYTERFTSQTDLDDILDNNTGVWDDLSEHSDAYLSHDDIHELEKNLMIQETVDAIHEGVEDAPRRHLSWSVFVDVVALLVPLNPGDNVLLTIAKARLVAGGARIASSGDSRYAGKITHVVVVGDPTALDMDAIRAALPVARTTGAQHLHPQRPAATWVVCSDVWVKDMAATSRRHV